MCVYYSSDDETKDKRAGQRQRCRKQELEAKDETSPDGEARKGWTPPSMQNMRVEGPKTGQLLDAALFLYVM